MLKVRSFLAGVALMTFALGTAIATADDNELNVSSDTSKNPITGSVTETDKYERKKTNPDGSVSKEKVTEKTKRTKDGKVTHSVDAEAEKKAE